MYVCKNRKIILKIICWYNNILKHFSLTNYITYIAVYFIFNHLTMNFINPINKLGNIKDVADEYEIEFNDIDKESAMGLYGVAILIWDQRIHAKFIIWFNINPKKVKSIQSIRFIPHEELPELWHFELHWNELEKFLWYELTNIWKILSHEVIKKLVRIIKSFQK